METAAQSADSEIAEELLHYFVDNGERECFAASLYTCYDLIKPDVAMEVSRCQILAATGPICLYPTACHAVDDSTYKTDLASELPFCRWHGRMV